MKRLPVLLLVLALAAAACGDDDTPTTPADDNRVQFKAALLSSNEVPAIPNPAEAAANGEATIDFQLTKDASGAITATRVDFRVDLHNFPSTSAITAAHIHTGAAGVSGPVLLSADVTSGQVTLTNGEGTFSRLGITSLSAANAQAIINNPAGFYFNVHTQANPQGVIRGQLVKQ
jgi:hypothetical protein